MAAAAEARGERSVGIALPDAASPSTSSVGAAPSEHSVHDARGSIRRLVPADEWAHLPARFRRLLLRDALLTEPSPGVPGSGGTAAAGRRVGGAMDAGAGGGERQRSMFNELSHDLRMAAAMSITSATASPRRRPAGRLRAAAEEEAASAAAAAAAIAASASKRPRGSGLSGALAVAYSRWRDAMEPLVVDAPPAEAAFRVDRLRRKTESGALVLAPDTLADLFPDLTELFRDGSGSLLSQSEIQRVYSALTSAFACICGRGVDLPAAPPADAESSFVTLPGVERREADALKAACEAYCDSRDAFLALALEEVGHAEAIGDHVAAERACDRAVSLDPTAAGPFLVRAGARLRLGQRWKCLEDIHIYLWWSTRQGFTPKDHTTAYWSSAEAYLTELEQRAEKDGAILQDRVFHNLLDQAESCLRTAFRHDRTGQLALSGSARHFIQRLEGHRAKRRMAAELLDSPLVQDASAAPGSELPEGPPAEEYSVPWPIDVSAGLPDAALFDRAPTVGSSKGHEPLDVLMLDFRSPLDLLATVQALTSRSRAFAQRNAECLHWKYRPKPVHIRVQADSVHRLALCLLCALIAKRVGGQSGTAFSMEEVPQDRALAALLTAVVFCRTLTPPQRREVDRMLTLLIFASMDEEHMRRMFPWLELDDGRKAPGGGDPGGDLGAGGSDASPASASSESGTQPQGESDSEEQRQHRGPSSGRWGASLLLSRLRTAWLGWLSVGAGGADAAAQPSPTGRGRATLRPPEESAPKRVDEEAVHRAARHHLLGPHAAAICASLDLASLAAGGGAASGFSQRRLWAVLGHLPAGGVPDGSGDAGDDLDDFDSPKAGVAAEDVYDPEVMSRPPDPRLRWRPLLSDLANLRPEAWRLNPLALDPVTWDYDPSALTDPFFALAWRIRRSCGGDSAPRRGTPWSLVPDVFAMVDPPLPPPPPLHGCPGGGGPPPLVVEVLWEVLLEQLKALSAVLNAFEAADSARAQMMVQDFDIPSDVGDIEKELADLKRRRHEASLDCELRDYVTLAAVRKKEQDWWGTSGANSVAYKEAMVAGATATWNPAPDACAPLRLRLSLFAGSPWQIARAASARGFAFDVIDARGLLCSRLGVLGLCTWFDAFLKTTPFAYIQTRHCEELFLLRSGSLEDTDAGPWTGAAAAMRARPVQSPPRTAQKLAAAGAVWPPPLMPDLAPPPGAPLRRVVVGPGGSARWEGIRSAPTTTASSQVLPPLQSPPARRTTVVNSKLVKTRRTIVDSENELVFRRPTCPGCGAVFAGDARFCTKCGSRRPPDLITDMLQSRLQPRRPGPAGGAASLPPLSARGPPCGQDGGVAAAAARTLSARGPAPPPGGPASPSGGSASPRGAEERRRKRLPYAYSCESALFRALLQESVSRQVPPAEMQHLLGLAARAEPLLGEQALGYLGAAGLPVRHDFVPWDSSLEVLPLASHSWPCCLARLDAAALGGTRPPPPRVRAAAADGPEHRADPIAVFGKYWRRPGDQELSETLGPRLLRLRRIGGHPSVSDAPAQPGKRRCANAAFCGRRVVLASDGPEATAGGYDPAPCRCPDCGVAAYCSAACQGTHFAAHAFECRSLQALRAAASSLDAAGPQEGRVLLASLLELLLAKQFSMVSRKDALSCRTALSTGLRDHISGARRDFRGGGKGFEDGGRDAHLLEWSQSVVDPAQRTTWSVDLQASHLRPSQSKERCRRRAEEAAREGAPFSDTALFDVRLSHAHSAAGVVRLMSRWVQNLGGAAALREVIDQGLVFCIITGLCQTQQFARRELAGYSMVSVLVHRMSLHIAASKEWRTLAPSMAPPRQFQAQGLQGLECAQYCAYHAFLQPLRLPFARLGHVLPIVCIAWGADAKRALLSMPMPDVGAEGPSDPPSASATPCARAAAAAGAGSPRHTERSLVSFLEVAADHIANVQLIDSVRMDVVTGQVMFPMYSSVLERSSGGGERQGEEAWVLLLDAGRGMQVVACPLPARELRRCSL